MSYLLFWGDQAQDDLAAIRAGLGLDAAKRVGRLIAETADCLVDHPDRGQPMGALRLLPLPGLPWRLVYRIGEKRTLTILRVSPP
jgi:plasmid stabilization system protein ParE